MKRKLRYTSRAKSRAEVNRSCHAGAAAAAAVSPAGNGAAGSAAEVRRMLSGVLLSAQAGGQDAEPPKRLLVVPWGLTETRDGPVLCDAETARVLPERQKAARADRVPIDFDHGAAFGAGRGKPRHIAGYGTPVVVENEGLVLADIRWTPQGREFWANYEDISPAFKQQAKTGRVTFLDSVALTPRGVIEGLTLFSAETEDDEEDEDKDDAGAKPGAKKPAKTDKTDPAKAGGDPIPDIMKLQNFLTKRKVTFDPAAPADTLLALAETEIEKITGDAETRMSAETDRLKKLEDKLASIESDSASRAKAADDARKADIIRQASAEGKLLPPDEVIKNMSAEDLQKTADAAAPGTVTGTGKPDPFKKTPTETAVTLSAEDKEVAAQMGVTEEQLRKFHGYGTAPVRVD